MRGRTDYGTARNARTAMDRGFPARRPGAPEDRDEATQGFHHLDPGRLRDEGLAWKDGCRGGFPWTYRSGPKPFPTSIPRA